jgi:hypothetical protein
LADDDSFQNQLDCEAEEFDRSLTRTARWLSPRNDFHPTPFHPVLHSHSSIIQFPHPGHYLLLGRVALGCRRDATFDSGESKNTDALIFSKSLHLISYGH